MVSPTPPAPLQTNSDLDNNWRKFENEFRKYIQESQPSGCTSEEQVAVLLNVIGEEGLSMFNQLNLTESQVNNIDEVMIALGTLCSTDPHHSTPGPDIIGIAQQREIFHQTIQQDAETFETFLSQIQMLAKSCGFGASEETMLLDRIKHGIRDVNTRQQLESAPELTLVNAISMCRISEILKYQSMEKINSAVLPRNKSEYFNSSSTECVLQTPNPSIIEVCLIIIAKKYFQRVSAHDAFSHFEYRFRK